MLFNSIEFILFLPAVFLLYWFVFQRNLRAQNFFLLVASYVFYGWWDWRFLSLIALSSFADYFIGLRMAAEEDERKRKWLLYASLAVNLGILGFFKYFNFFVDNFVAAFATVGVELHPRTLNIILPVGISFYTFQTLSYSIDIYRRKLEPTRDVIAFFAFVSFFPQLVAGPIERAKNLLPQFFKPRTFRYEQAADGMRQILWGAFKKVVIADNCAMYVDDIFANYQHLPAGSLVLGTVLFAFQIYGDFSGYSDIAIGTARLFGFQLMRNFAYPYFSRDIAEFWRRWHISLSTWFRDYLYIPLGGSRGPDWMKVRNVFAIFLISGFWHGANWTFIVWGAINALYFLPLLLAKRNRQNLDIVAQGRLLPSPREALAMGSTFALTCLAWIFFRAENLSQAVDYTLSLFSPSLFEFDVLPKRLLAVIGLFLLIEWLQRDKEHALQLDTQPVLVRWGAYNFVFLIIFFFGVLEKNAFIYFQF